MVEQRRMRKKRSNENHKFIIWQTVFEVDSKYIPVEAVGEGSYGVVCSSINKETNEKVAIKKLSDVFGTKSDALRTLRELVILRKIRHENVIQLKDVMITCAKSSFTEVYLVYELMDFDLQRVIASPLPLSNDHCRFFLFQLLQGLKYLHSANVLHRDLKPENLFVNANCDLKIGDFGLSRTSKKGKDDENMTEYVVTRWYRAPELLLRNSCYDASIDVWSVGCIFAELLGRKPLFPGKTSLDQLKLIIDVLGSPCSSDLKLINDPRTLSYIKSFPETNGIRLVDLYAHVDGLALDLLQKMLVFNPKKRITITEALQHPYLCQLHSSINDEAYNININKPLDINIDSDINEAKLRELIWREYVVYHPRAAYYSLR